MKRSISLILVLAMLATAMLGITSFAEEEAPVATASDALTVYSARVEFGNTVYLHIAVKADSADGLKLTITNTVLDDDDPDKTVTLDPDTSIVAPEGCVAFRYGKLGAKNMGDKLSIQASQGDVVGKAKTYSILEYALTAENENDAELTALVKAMIKYGAKAQVAFGHADKATYPLQDAEKNLIDYSYVKFIGGGSFTDADGNSVTKAIMAPGETLEGIKHVGDGAADTDIWYNTAMQRRGTSAASSIPYTSANQNIFVVPASVANSADYELDMDEYTGNGGEYYGYKNSSGNMTTGFQAHNGVGGTSADKEGWFSGTFANTSLNADGSPKSKIVVQKGYLMWEPGTGINFNSNSPSKASYESVGAYAAAAIAGTSTEGLNGKFTISITMAADGSGKAPISRFHLRTNKTGVITTGNAAAASGDKFVTAGRLSLFSASGTTLRVIYNTAASSTTSTGTPIVTLPTNAEEGKPGDFVTIHIVVTIDGTGTCPVCKGVGTKDDADCASCTDGKANTLEYYVNDGTTPVVTVINPAPMNFWTYFWTGSKWQGSFNGECGNNSGYLKSFVITKGNITEYFK